MDTPQARLYRRVAPAVTVCGLLGAPLAPAHGDACPWDLDGGGSVGISDLPEFMAQWGTDPGGPPDFDGGGVGITDFLALLEHWGACPGTFDPLLTLTHGPETIVQDFWSPDTRNLLCVGDSIMKNGSPARLYDAILRSWDIPAGWHGYHATTDGTTNGVRRWLGFSGPYDGENAFRTLRTVTQASFGGTHFYGLPHHHLEHDIGIGFDPNENGCLIELAWLNPSGFEVGTVGEWYTGNPLTAQLMYLYHSGPAVGETYAPTVNVAVGSGMGVMDGGPWWYHGDFAPEHGLSDIARGEPGLNLLSRKHPIPTDQGPNAMRLALYCTGNWELPLQLWSIHLGVKLEGGPGGLFAGVLAENSWNSYNWIPDTPATSTTKQFTNAELDRYLDLMFDDKASPLYVVIVEGPEPTPLEEYVANNNARNDRLQAAWQRVGGAEVRFIYIGIYRTADDGSARNQNQAFYRTADERSDTYYVNLYGLLGGILWTKSDIGGDQSAYAEARGWDAIETNGGLIDMSTRNALDDGAIHPRNVRAAFFFAWVAGEKIRQMSGN